MATSFLRYSALASAVSTVTGFAISEFPTQTVGGATGTAHLPGVTEAPQSDLVKVRLAKKAINVCSEWTIPGGFGQPSCYNSETCLFTSDGLGFYEGCGQTSVAYNWITECWDYPQVGIAPASETYCDEVDSKCGYYAFVFAPGATFFNYGCSTRAYSLTVELLDISSSSVVLAGGGTTQATVTPNPTVTVQGSDSSDLPNVGSHENKKSNIGPIVGGAVGGVVFLAALATLALLLLRKSKKDRAARIAGTQQTQQQQADAATSTAWQAHNNGVPGVTGKPVQQQIYAPPPIVYANAPNEKAQQAYRPPPQSNYGSELSTEQAAQQQSPPPVYAQPSPATRPPSTLTELDPSQRTPSVGPPVSPIGTLAPTLAPTSSELGGDSRVGSPAPQHAELGGRNTGTYQVPPNVQEIGPGTSTGGITRPPQRQSNGVVDMSGAPMSEEYHHELP